MTSKTKTMYLVRYFPAGAFTSRGVGYKGRLVSPTKKTALVNRLRRCGVDAFAERFKIRA